MTTPGAPLPPHLQSVLAGLAERQAKRDAFEHSPRFLQMRNALLTAREAVTVYSEDFLYFAERSRREAGWLFASDEDIALFFYVMADTTGPGVDADSVTSDEKCPFFNFTMLHYGLHVGVLSGQGTSIRVSNRPLQRAPAP